MSPPLPPRKHKRRVGPFTDPADAARAAALRHVRDDLPGIARRRSGKGFSYAGPDGTTLRDRAAIKRIKALVIPPAWTAVWICPDEHGHLQATGRDARGRKQYRYHHEWRKVRDETKYGRMVLFGETLPSIREHVRGDLQGGGLSRERVLATIVRLLELTLIRVGNEEYARTNNSFGLTTMLDRHVQIAGSDIIFRFRGKGGKAHEIFVSDRRLATLVKRCRDVPGQDLFQYIDEVGERRPVNSGDVNEYLQRVSGQDFTAKDYRTWAGTLLAARELRKSRTDPDVAPKSAMLRAIELVAGQLGNTPAVCRKSYIHPVILQAFEDQSLFDQFAAEQVEETDDPGFSGEEGALLRFLRGLGH